MLKKREHDRSDLFNLSHSCVLFKKYYEYNLWFGHFREYHNIIYCKKCIQKYVYCWVNLFLLQRFSLSTVAFLCKSPCLLKYLESGFFKHLDHCFLLAFYNNCFPSDIKGKQKIKVFVKSYFQSVLKSRIEKDISILIIKTINEISLKILLNCLANRLKNIDIYAERVLLEDKALVKPVLINSNKKFYFIVSSSFNHLVKKSFYESCFLDCSSLCKTVPFYSIINLNKIYHSLLSLRFVKTNKKLKSTKICKLEMEKKFIIYPRRTILVSNKDVHRLVESLENSSGINDAHKKIGLYKSANFSSDILSSPNNLLSKKPFKGNRLFPKKFNNFFVKYKYERFL